MLPDFITVMLGGKTKAEKAGFKVWLDHEQSRLKAEIAREESRVRCWWCYREVYPEDAVPVITKAGVRYRCNLERRF